ENERAGRAPAFQTALSAIGAGAMPLGQDPKGITAIRMGDSPARSGPRLRDGGLLSGQKLRELVGALAPSLVKAHLFVRFAIGGRPVKRLRRVAGPAVSQVFQRDDAR